MSFVPSATGRPCWSPRSDPRGRASPCSMRPSAATPTACGPPPVEVAAHRPRAGDAGLVRSPVQNLHHNPTPPSWGQGESQETGCRSTTSQRAGPDDLRGPAATPSGGNGWGPGSMVRKSRPGLRGDQRPRSTLIAHPLLPNRPRRPPWASARLEGETPERGVRRRVLGHVRAVPWHSALA